MTMDYIGSGNYCYANSTAMVLQSFGFNYDPGYIECLTTVANSAFWTSNCKNPFIFFSSRYNNPDIGISLALTNLGFEFDEFYCNSGDKPTQETLVQKLKEFLKYGAVVVGPLDMGKLTYIPYAKDLKGVDHYIAIYSIDNNIHAHDPAGYPYIQMEVCEFLEAWKAASIKYRRGSYSMWGNFRRIHDPSPLEVFTSTDRAIKHYIELERESEENDSLGSKAILKLANLIIEGKLSPVQRGNLAYFSFPLSARRCNDYAKFFHPYDSIRSNIKAEQAKCFGLSQMCFMKKNWKQLNDVLYYLSDLEENFQLKTLGV
jgi:hypothetical protein